MLVPHYANLQRHPANHTGAAAAQGHRMIGMVVTTGMHHQRTSLKI
jgi:hypothetical protein